MSGSAMGEAVPVGRCAVGRCARAYANIAKRPEH
jgi:hypothetical protein